MKPTFTYKHTTIHVGSSASGSSLALEERKSAKAVMRFIVNTSTCGQPELHCSATQHGVHADTQPESKGSDGGGGGGAFRNSALSHTREKDSENGRAISVITE